MKVLAAKWHPLAAATFFAGFYSTVSIQQHRTLKTGGYDLGIFEQIIRGWSHLRIPVSPIVDNAHFAPNHFSPVLALLGPPYALLPSVYTLLIAQAILFAIGVIPLMRWAQREFGGRTAWVVAASYGLCPGLAGAVGDGFHEIAFAVPLISFSVVALGQRRHVAAVAWAVPLVFIKEDLGLTIAAIGSILVMRGERKLGFGAAIWGLTWTAVSMVWLIPLLSQRSTYLFTSAMAPRGIGNTISTIFTASDTKLLTVLLLLLPVGFICLRSPLTLLILPTLAWRFTADNFYYWSMGNQYDAVLVPIVVAGMIDGLGRIRSVDARKLSIAAAVTGTVLLTAGFDFVQVVQPSFWQITPHVRAAMRLMDEIPNGATTASSMTLTPHLTGRTTAYVAATPETFSHSILPNDWKSADWFIVDTTYPTKKNNPYTKALENRLENGFSIIDESHGLVLARRGNAATE